MSELYSGTESAVRCSDAISDLFRSCSVSFGNVEISDLDFTDDAVIFAETLDILLGALAVLNEESELL